MYATDIPIFAAFVGVMVICPLPQTESPVLQFVLIASSPITEKILAPTTLYLPFRYSYILMRAPSSLLFSRLNSITIDNLSRRFLGLQSTARCLKKTI